MIEKRWQEKYQAVKRRLRVCCSYSETDIVCVKIRYQEMTSGECKRLRTLACV
jgi:hypothetical protein